VEVADRDTLAHRDMGRRVSEVEIKFLFLVLFVLGALATTAQSEAVLPAYLVGLIIAGVFVRDRVLVYRIRSIAFALLTPFFFLKAGTLVSVLCPKGMMRLSQWFAAICA